ncbi:MAG: hypothetical protein KGV59_05205 [Tenacibaculum sp.]|nr:hypothetical protein [Tenacibaculum sp.]
MKKYILTILFTLTTALGFSQIHEVGVFVGGSNFIGDIGTTKYIYPNKIGGGIVYKYNYNPRIAFRGNYNYIKLKGDDSKSSNTFKQQRGYKFTNVIQELALGIEFNFFDYNIRERETAYTPYILFQASAFRYKAPVKYVDNKLQAEYINEKIETKNKTSYTLPLGIGFKGRINDYFAFAIETGVRFTLNDDLDYSTKKIKKLNFVGNGNDTYVFTAFSIVYTFGKPPCYEY